MMCYYDNPYKDYDWDYYGYPGEYVFGDDAYIEDCYLDERWKPINGFCRKYWISNFGRVWSTRSQSFLKVKPMDDHGHLGVCLYADGERYYRYIHRLVAEEFIPNPNRYPIVRHIDDIPYYNTVEDLMWGTQRDNFYDSVKNGRAYIPTDEDRRKGNLDRMTPLIAINLTSGEKLYFESQGEASRALNIQQSNIWKVLNGVRRSAGNYTFKYGNRGDYNECY